MIKTEPVIKNKYGEKLDTWVETPNGAIKATVVMVHGFGTNKHETAGYFDDISHALTEDSFRVVRFDFSGYGKSEGRQEDACYSKHVGDLNTILDYVKTSFSDQIFIFSQSMGTWVTALTSPMQIAKTIFTGIPNSKSQVIINRFIERFSNRPGAVFDINGVSLLPRSTGKVQKIGPRFWEDIQDLNPLKIVTSYSQKTQLLIVHWENDEIIGKDYLSEYDVIPTLKSIWLSGDHSVTDQVDRQNFIKIMLKFYNE